MHACLHLCMQDVALSALYASVRRNHAHSPLLSLRTTHSAQRVVVESSGTGSGEAASVAFESSRSSDQMVRAAGRHATACLDRR